MRPGAPFAPLTVWQELQSPEVTEPFIDRTFAPSVTFALNGARGGGPPAGSRKLPAALVGISKVFPFESVTMTVRFGGPPLQSFASCGAG